MAPDLPDLSLVLTTPADAPGPRPSRWADLRLRVISAAVLLPVGLFCLWFALWSWALLVAAAALGMALEWVALCRAPRLGRAMRGAAIAAGLLYIGVPLACVIWLRADPVGVADLLFLLLIVWCGDIGAYAAGRWFGGPKLAPLISPGKTWSGAAGGLLASVLAGVVTSLALAGAASLPRRRPAGERGQALGGGEGFRPLDPRPWRPAGPARRGADRRPGGRLVRLGRWAGGVSLALKPRQ